MVGVAGGQGGLEGLEPAAADGREGGPPGVAGRGPVQVDGDPGLGGDPPAGPLGQGDAVQVGVLAAAEPGLGAERDERQHVQRPHPRVHAAVVVEVDQAGAGPGPGHGRLDQGRARAHQGDDRAVVVGVAGPVEHQHPGVGPGEGGHDLVDHLGPAPLRDVGHALDQAGELEPGHGPAPAGAPAPATTVPPLTTTSARLTPRW